MRIRSTAQQAYPDREIGSAEQTGMIEGRNGADVLFAPGDPRVHSLARAAFDPDDPLSRMARSLRGSIAASAALGGGPIRSVAVMGLHAAAEASILAANLAISYAQLGTQTVLVEANLGEALQGRLLNTRHDKGLLEVLSGESDARSTVEPSAVRGLSIITTGVARDGAMMLLDGERFHRRAMPLLDAFGMMVVDVGIAFNDPPAMCEALDAAVVVVRRDVTSIDDIRRLVGRLEEMKTRVVGSVIAT